MSINPLRVKNLANLSFIDLRFHHSYSSINIKSVRSSIRRQPFIEKTKKYETISSRIEARCLMFFRATIRRQRGCSEELRVRAMPFLLSPRPERTLANLPSHLKEIELLPTLPAAKDDDPPCDALRLVRSIEIIFSAVEHLFRADGITDNVGVVRWHKLAQLFRQQYSR